MAALGAALTPVTPVAVGGVLVSASAALEWGHAHFRTACVNHDNCYHHGWCSYKRTREGCDDGMYHDMRQICEDIPFYRPDDQVMCWFARETFYRLLRWDPLRKSEASYLGPRGTYNCYASGGYSLREECLLAAAAIERWVGIGGGELSGTDTIPGEGQVEVERKYPGLDCATPFCYIPEGIMTAALEQLVEQQRRERARRQRVTLALWVAM